MAQAPSGVNRFYYVLGVGALAGIAALVYQVNKPKAVSIPVNVTVLAADTAGFRGYFLGSDSAKLEVTEYADYQCPVCQDFENIQFPAVRQQLIETGMVRWRYRDFPLEMHPNSRVASHAAACANDQGKFWEVHEALYQHQAEWAPLKNPAGKYSGYAKAAGLDVSQFDQCMQSAKYAGRIQASLDEGLKLGVNGTPNFVIAGRLYPTTMPSDSIRAIVLRSLAQPATPAPAQ
ncbi:MAG TPA: thioredoxin domain-containing protein [Gemmatimonadales bacterium]|nr:thioredoxin domain-containing protein [Gemmatimonadales bacterium]